MNLVLKGCKFTYFNLAGRGEACRLALSIGGVTDFIDERIPFSEWKSLKPNTPWGSLPVLTLAVDSNEEDDTCTTGTKQIAQQRAILRFVGREVGLYPTNNDSYQAAKMDELMDVLEDIGAKTNAAGQGLEQSAKEAERLKAVSAGGVTHSILTKVDEFIAENGTEGHAVGDTLTVADLFVYTSCSNLVSGMLDGVPANALEPFPNIEKCRKLVRSHPAVTKWYDELKNVEMPASYGPL